MSLLEGLLVALLLVGSGLAGWLLKRQHDRAMRALREAGSTLAISREAASRQLLELRAQLAAAQAEAAGLAALHDEITRLRNKYRRLHGHYTRLAEQHHPDSPKLTETPDSDGVDIAAALRPGDPAA